MSEKQVAPWRKASRQLLNHPPLFFNAKIDQHIATEDHIQPPQPVVMFEIVIIEYDFAPNELLYVI